MNLSEHVSEKLKTQLPAQHVEIIDNSWQHAGHAGGQGAAHLHITVVSEAFSGINLMEQHRMIHRILADEMAEAIHAMELVTFTPEAFATRR